jgi:hypothetical protein
MSELIFSPEADEQLSQLQAESALTQLYERVNDALDGIEDDPAAAENRRRRYSVTKSAMWGVPVHGAGEDWIVLWSESADGPYIHYVGPDLR